MVTWLLLLRKKVSVSQFLLVIAFSSPALLIQSFCFRCSVCAVMTAYAGGYYKLQDDHGNDQGTEIFPQTETSKRVCFIFDETKPAHCTETGGTCSSEPMELSTRLTRYPEVNVQVTGWSDPRPPGGGSRSASGIEKYRLEVHAVDVGLTSLSVQVQLLCHFVFIFL